MRARPELVSGESDASATLTLFIITLFHRLLPVGFCFSTPVYSFQRAPIWILPHNPLHGHAMKHTPGVSHRGGALTNSLSLATPCKGEVTCTHGSVARGWLYYVICILRFCLDE